MYRLEVSLRLILEMAKLDSLQDPRGEDIGMLTGVTLWDEKLYLGSLHNDYIGVYDLQ